MSAIDDFADLLETTEEAFQNCYELILIAYLNPFRSVVFTEQVDIAQPYIF